MKENQLEECIPEFNFNAFVTDTMRHFYNHNYSNGYKNCSCSSCQKLLYPILIKEHRDPNDYEFLHKKYTELHFATEGDLNNNQ